MSDYRRWISYIYSYEHGEKKDNAGYARIELKDGRVKMTIYMTPGRKDGSVKVCFYKGQRGHLAGVPLGNLDLSVPSPTFRIETSASNIMDSGLFFVEMNGLLLVKEDGQYYASAWEEDSLEEDVARDIIRLLNGKEKSRGERERKTESKEEAKEMVENQRETEGKGSQREVKGNEENNKETGMKRKGLKEEEQRIEKQLQKNKLENYSNSNSLKTAEIKGMPEIAGTAGDTEKETEEIGRTKEGQKTKTAAGMENRAEADGGSETREKDGCESKKETGEKDGCEKDKETAEKDGCEKDKETVEKDGCEKDGCEKDKEEEGTGIEGGDKISRGTEKENGCEEGTGTEKGTKEAKITETTRMDRTSYKNCCMGASLAERIFCCLPPMYPFEEAKYEKGVRMNPQDIGMLPRPLWKLAGNSFLLHAYYTYHHLLFVKQRQRDGASYFLMLPGIYNRKEQNIAQMFGFFNFCAVKRKNLEQGDFGYWYLEVKF